MTETKIVEKIRKHISLNNLFFLPESCRLSMTVEKYFTAGKATNDNTGHAL